MMPQSVRNFANNLTFFPWHPFLVAMLPGIHFYKLNMGLLEFEDLSKAVLLSLLLVGLLLLVGRLIWNSFNSAALLLTPLAFIIFKGHSIGWLGSLVLLFVCIALGLVLPRRPSSTAISWPRKLNLPLNIALLYLVFMPLTQGLRADYHDKAPQPTVLQNSPLMVPEISSTQNLPDIYYILVDGLGQPAMIESEYPITRAEFSDLFAHRGFQINHHSFANYPQTALSVAGTMNVAPVQNLLTVPSPNSQDRRTLTEIAGHSRVLKAFSELGYKIVNFPSGYPMTKQPLAHQTHQPVWAPNFVEYYLFRDGFLPLIMPLLGQGPADFSFAMRRGRLNFIFDNLAGARLAVKDEEPVFVYAHILAPHPPFVFGRQGEALKSRSEFGFADGNHWLDIHGRQDQSYRRRYADQASWIMKRLAKTIDEIMASSTHEKIIIIQGDHGPGSGLEWEDPEKSDLYERMGIFNAWYNTQGLEVPLYDGMTAINTFPILFNSFFSGQLSLQDDDLWFATMSHPFVFSELAVDSLFTTVKIKSF